MDKHVEEENDVSSLISCPMHYLDELNENHCHWSVCHSLCCHWLLYLDNSVSYKILRSSHRQWTLWPWEW